MEFTQPDSLWWILLLPLLGWSLARARRRRSLASRAIRATYQKPTLAPILALTAWTLIVFSVSGPVWNSGSRESLPPGRDLLVLIDVSQSMAVQDAFPSRLGAAQQSAISLIRELGRSPGDRAGLVVFAGRAALRCPLTSNLGAVVEAIQSLRAGEIQPPSSNLGAGLLTALDAFDDLERVGGRVLVVLTDGEDFGNQWFEPSKKLLEAGIIVHSIAFGDADRGHPIPLPNGQGMVQYKGKPALSIRVDSTLQSLSETTGGTLVRLGVAAADLGKLYRERIERLAARTRLERARLHSRSSNYVPFVSLALLLLLVPFWPQSRTGWRGIPGFVLLTIALVGADAPQTGDLSQLNEGIHAYHRGDFPKALAHFESVLESEPALCEAHYNAAATLFQLQRFAESRRHYTSARLLATPRLRLKIDFALGNTSLALGEVDQAIRDFDRCLTATTSLPNDPQTNAIRHDALANREFARQLPKSPQEPPETTNSDGPGRPSPSTSPTQSPQLKAQAPPTLGPSPTSNPEKPESGPSTSNATSNSRSSPQKPQTPDSPPGASSNSQETSYEEALDHIRRARQRRLDDGDRENHDGPNSNDRKDW